MKAETDLRAYEVVEVALRDPPPGELRGFGIDSPKRGGMGDSYTLQVDGWVVGRDSPAEMVELTYNDRVVRRTPVRGTRADVAADLGVGSETDCVFHAAVGLVGLRLETTLGVRVVLEGGARIEAGSIAVRRAPLRTRYEPRLAPLLVTSLGRSGTTLLMKMLASHPEIVVLRRFPYESAPAKYWLHMLKVLTEPANLVDSAHPETFFSNFWWVGSNPFNDELVQRHAPLERSVGRAYVERLAVFCQQSIDDWYTTLARYQDQPAAVYFAEKHLWPNYLPVLTWELYPRTKEVFLVRDFRDMAVSAMGFDERRGGESRPPGTTDEEYLRGPLRKMALDLRQSWRTRGDRGHLLRYEDLIRDGAASLRALFAYLEVDASQPTVDAVLEASAGETLALPGSSQEDSEVAVHRASADPEDSIGRWRRERDESFRTLVGEAFAEPLREFGYET